MWPHSTLTHAISLICANESSYQGGKSPKLFRLVRRHYAVVVLGMLVIILRRDCIAGARLGLGKSQVTLIALSCIL